ncbi:MAG: radical SAM protein [Oscillospiraceae bacterium]|jgi:TatD family-associated radical SAM protein|nr:radical SAM protein [Oscillospiraceae bacterium]
MAKAMTVTYEAGENLYINVTNRCPCACTFCIRNNGDGAYGSDPLWLEHEPDMEEMKADLAKRDLTAYRNIVFCGYGEPLMRLHFVCELAKYLREIAPDCCLRLNTNGLADIYNPAEAGGTAAEQVAAVFDKVSISLNGGNAAVYNRVTRPSGGGDAPYETMLRFAGVCRDRGMDVLFTVVDVITPEEIVEARKKAEELGIPMEVREYIH